MKTTLRPNLGTRMVLSLFVCALAACSGGGGRVVPAVQPAQAGVQGGGQFAHRVHALTFENALDSPQAIDQTFGWHNWQYIKPYLDLVREPRGVPDQVALAGGLTTTAYTDPNLCAGSYPVGGTPYASPDCVNVDASAFYTQPGNPQNILTGSYNGTLQQRVGDPGSPAMQATELAAIKAATSQGHYMATLIDDAGTPNEYYGGSLCWGLGTFQNNGYSCTGSPGGVAGPPWSTNYSLSEWQAGEQTMAEQLPVQVIFNGLQSTSAVGPAETQASVTKVIIATHNAWGGMCETCFYTANNIWTMTNPILSQRLTGIMNVINAGKNVIVVNNSETDPTQREQGLAETMLVYEPEHLYESGPCGNVSHVHACPEAALTFYDPYKGYPTSPQSVADPGGTYSREFAACYSWGKPVGPCATVVNPDVYNPHPMPTLKNTYAHTVAISGTSLCNCYGDSGAVATTGPAAPATLAPGAGFVVFR